ncbi:MAG: OsmC family protein [Alphaproteobacteria bacterium]|nr:OsmC family protein [Alphaproteobacteria bacterium]
MTKAMRIREVAERNVRILTLKPSRGHLTGVSTARITDGLRCEVQEGPWTLATDMPAKAGGDETAPSPGVLGRAALSSCLAISISMWAARLGIPLGAVEVEVQADFDARGELGMGEDIPPGYQEVRYAVSIESPAPMSELRKLVETAERYSPYIDVFGRAQPMRRALSLNGEEV